MNQDDRYPQSDTLIELLLLEQSGELSEHPEQAARLADLRAEHGPEIDRLGATLSSLTTPLPEAPGSELPPLVRERILQAAREVHVGRDVDAERVRGTAQVPVVEVLPAGRSPIPWLLAGAGLAAAVLVGLFLFRPTPPETMELAQAPDAATIDAILNAPFAELHADLASFDEAVFETDVDDLNASSEPFEAILLETLLDTEG